MCHSVCQSGFKALQRVFEEDSSSNICIANSISLSPMADPLAYEDTVDKLMKNHRKNATVDGLIWGSLNSLRSEATGSDTELKAALTISLKYLTVLFALIVDQHG